MKIEDKGDAFDWAWAFWLWLSHNHSGMRSDEYAAMSKLDGEYCLSNVPNIDVDNNDCDDYEMAVMYYHELSDDNWQDKFAVFCDYMDNEWDKDD